MASKKFTFKGGQLADTDQPLVGFTCDDESGLKYLPDPNTGSTGTAAYATKTFRVSDTKNPLWNQVTYDIERTVTASSLYSGHVTLQGLKDDGTFNDIMEEPYSITYDATSKDVFDLLESACTGAQHGRVPYTNAAGTITVKMPLRYSKYESVDIMPTWYDTAWTKRIQTRINRSGGRLHGGRGHMNDYKVISLPVAYDADMNADFSDLRFTGPDGLDELSYYILTKTDSTSAVVLVAVPWWIQDREAFKHITTGREYYSEDNAISIFMYYGNTAATTTSDVTLGGATCFYDDFDDASIDATKWPTTGGTVTETGGYLELKVPASSASTASVISCDIDYLQDHTIEFMGGRTIEVIWEVEAIVPLSGTTAAQGPIMRIRNSDDDYFECSAQYQAAGLLGGSAQYYFGTGDGGAKTYPYHSGTGTTTKRWIKCLYTQGATATTGMSYGLNRATWFHSYNGYDWDIIQSNQADTGATAPQTKPIQVAMYHIGPNTVASDRYCRYTQVIAYETTGSEHDYMSDHFQNGALTARWNTSVGTGTLVESVSAVTATLTAASNHRWTGAAWEPVGFYTALKQGGFQKNTVHVFEAKLNSVAAVAAGSMFATINIFNTTTIASQEAIHWGLERTSAGVITPFAMRQSNGTQVDMYSAALGNVTAIDTTAVWLRIVVDPYQQRVSFDYSIDGIEWIHQGSSNAVYADAYLNGAYYGVFGRNTTTNSCSCVWDYIRAYSMGDVSFDTKTWSGEESLADYPLLPTAPTDDDLTLTFATPAGMPRNNALYIRTKKFGGGYSNSKPMWISDRDHIDIGPDGTDKYIGMRLVVDFNFDDTDEFKITEMSFLYEVI
jgi:hypothetical protein